MSVHIARMDAALDSLAGSELDALVVGVGPDLEYLTAYTVHELERLNVLVLTPGPPATMIIPELEAPAFPAAEGVELRSWSDGDDPFALLFEVLGDVGAIGIGDSLRARSVLPILAARPGLRIGLASTVIGPLRARKSPEERDLIARAGAAADAVTAAVMEGEVDLVGRAERDVSIEIRRRLVEAGHDTAEFAIVVAGPNAASPHHAPGDRLIGRDEVVLFDIGGRLAGYCSDTTRCVHTGPVPTEIAEAWQVLRAAQDAAVAAARPGTSCAEVDEICREVVREAGYGPAFIHRTGHGIGLEGHEEPYIVAGNGTPLEVGHAFSVEPGIYVEGRWGLRLEDIVVIDDDGLFRANTAPRDLVEV